MALVAGCAQDQGSTLSCPGPGETGCDSLSTVYESVVAEGDAPAEKGVGTGPPTAPRVAPAAAEPRLRPPLLLKVWIAPWRDEDGDLHDQQHVYIVLSSPRWDIGAGQPADGSKEAPE